MRKAPIKSAEYITLEVYKGDSKDSSYNKLVMDMEHNHSIKYIKEHEPFDCQLKDTHKATVTV